MMIAGLVATGVTEIEDIHHIERGYENVVDKFRSSELIFRGKNFRTMTKRFKWAQAEKNRSLLYGRLRFKL